VTTPNADSIAEALQRELAGQGGSPTDPSADPSAAQIPAEPAIPTWKIQIYTGKDVRIEEVELPVEKEETEEESTTVSGLWKTIQGVVSKKSN
jgi:hypothetical protein